MVEIYTTSGENLKYDSVGKIKLPANEIVSIQFHDYRSADLEWARMNFGIDFSIMENVDDIEISSHFHENDVQSSFHFSIPRFLGQKDVMVEESLFMILTDDKIFGFFKSRLETYLNDIYGHKFETKIQAISSVEDLFRFLIEFLSDYYADVTENIAKRIKILASRVLVKKDFQDDDLDTITQLNFNNLLVKESINEFVRILMLYKKSVRSSKIDVKAKIEEELADLTVISDYIQFNFERLDDLKENISNKIELEQNRIFKLLTIITFCISTPTLIAGIYGMNFGNMPELEWKYGYLFAIVAMILSIAVPLIYFKRKKWL